VSPGRKRTRPPQGAEPPAPPEAPAPPEPSFEPTVGDVDLYLFNEGRHRQLWRMLGAHERTHQGVDGVSFAVWAPAARGVAVAGDFNDWDPGRTRLRALGSSGVWEGFAPGAVAGQRYKFEVVGSDGIARLKADPMARATELPPATASVVEANRHVWGDEAWITTRATTDQIERHLAVYEVHLASWRRVVDESTGPDGRPLTYAEAAVALADHVTSLGFTHVQLMPVAEHPFGGSWGYQVTSYYAPTARHGTPDDFRAFVDVLHQRGVGVIVDWVPAHFPKDEWALARFDGTALYEHADPRQGEHPDWGTLVFNFGRTEVRNFLVANALYWFEEFHIDGLRVDAVASMLYLDYSRQPGEWIPNPHGGNENLDAIAFLQETNTEVHAARAGVLTIAEESTAWPGVSRPVHHGGLGFTHKWNMGWMHDTLRYFARDPIHRRYHQHDLTFGLMYAWSENFVLPLSHDEVVHGKGSLIGRMPGDQWQRFANLRALLGLMWAHPGKELLFMGGEIAQEREWNHDRSIDWHLLDQPLHAGVRDLVADLNRVQRHERALWADDFGPAGFRWIAADDTARAVLSFLRLDPTGGARPVVCVASLMPTVHQGYRVGVPHGGAWETLLATDDQRYGGSGIVPGRVEAVAEPWHGFDHSLELTLPPLGVVWLAPSP
jgi:1,4-alpha-glucan branching enzyme